jgi:DNA adenine methylase
MQSTVAGRASAMHSVDTSQLTERAGRTLTASPRPFLRWAGSKRAVAAQIVPHLPANFGRYWEPFVGGGTLFFLLRPDAATLADACGPLMATYDVVRDDPARVSDLLMKMPVDRETYYEVRGTSPQLGTAEHAARFIYLNKLCWNGLYRVNSSGKFNVPYGRPKSANLGDPLDLKACAEQLAKPDVSLQGGDFAHVIRDAEPGDLVYLDPPYATSYRNTMFIDYNEVLFSWADQQRLASLALELRARGVHVLVTNAACSAVRDLYQGFEVVDLVRHSTIAGNAAKRGITSELLFVGNV